MKVRLAAAAAVGLTALAAPSAMGAPAVRTDLTCYREGSRVNFLGSGFPPGQQVSVSLDGRQLAGTLTTNSLGNVLDAVVGLPKIPRSEQTRTLTVSQVGNPTLRATVSFRETAVYVVTKPRRFKPGKRLRIRAGGFYGVGPTLYVHIRGARKRNLRIGKIKGPCGKVSATRKRLLKKGDPHTFYLVQFDTVRRYRGRNVPLGFRYAFNPIFRFSRASSFSSPLFSTPVLGTRPRLARGA